jgi:S1-C subfamily serine protease
MNPFIHNSDGKNNWAWAIIVVGLIALHNQHLIKTDPENTYPKRIRRALRLWINPAETELEKHLIGKGIVCEEPERLYQKVAGATVVIETRGSIGSGVFIGPRLIATADHVVNGKKLRILLPQLEDDALAKPGRPIGVDYVNRIKGLDLAFVTTQHSHHSWLNLERNLQSETNMMIVGHPKAKYYSLQKARIKKKESIDSSEFVIFKNNEIFFGNSGGAMVNCNGNLVGIVSMMSNYQSGMFKQGIGINANTLQRYIQKLKLG